MAQRLWLEGWENTSYSYRFKIYFITIFVKYPKLYETLKGLSKITNKTLDNAIDGNGDLKNKKELRKILWNFIGKNGDGFKWLINALEFMEQNYSK